MEGDLGRERGREGGGVGEIKRRFFTPRLSPRAVTRLITTHETRGNLWRSRNPPCSHPVAPLISLCLLLGRTLATPSPPSLPAAGETHGRRDDEGRTGRSV